MKLYLPLLALLLITPVATAQEPSFDVLNGTVDGAPAGEMMKRYLDRAAQPYFDQRVERYESLETAEDLKPYQERLQSLFIEHIGGFPERTPLNPQVVGGETFEDYRYEKVIYESRPGMFVTATFYLPLGDGPFPGVLVPCGHDVDGKAGETYQRASILLAKNGIAALCYDPIGQGERFYFFDAEGKPDFSTTVEHSLLGAGAILLGTNTANYRIWDGIRGLDYLESRPEINKDRLGCTGNSGGGTLTSYIMALDPRVYCAAPSCYITSYPRLLETIGPQDAEQCIHAQIAFGMDHADYIHMRAPRPTLICSATQDFFDIEGTWNSFREAKRLYTRLGVPEQVSLVEVDATHGFSKPLREGMVRWMRRWLLHIDEPVVEPDFPIHPVETLWCTPNGKTAELEGQKDPFALNMELEAELAPQRAAKWQEGQAAENLEKVRELIRMPAPAELSAASAESRGISRNGQVVEKLILRPEPGIALPALYFSPSGHPASAVLYLHGESKSAEAGPGGAIEKLLAEGKSVLAVDLRGIGETAASYYSGDWDLVGHDWPDVSRAYLIDQTFVGMRAADILRCAKYLKQRTNAAVEVIAQGETTVPALHAAALAPADFAHLTLRQGIPSWSEVINTPRAKHQWVNTVHDALRWYDLPNLIATLPQEKLTTEEMAVPVF